MWSNVLIQLFWISFTAVGAAGLLLWRHRYQSIKKPPLVYQYVASRHPLVLTFLATALGLAAMAIGFAPAYLLGLPTNFMIGFYLAVLLASLVVLGFNWRLGAKWLTGLAKLERRSLIWVLPLAGLVIFYCALWLHVGSSLQLDTPVQLARVTDVAAGHTSLKDSYFGNNGVYDTRYSIDLISSLMGIGTKLLNTSALTFWLNSFAWLGVVSLLAIFSLSWELFDGQFRRLVAYSSIAIAPLLFVGYFFNSPMPTEEAMLWTMLLLIGLKALYTIKNGSILILAAVLLAATQPINCAMAIGFLALLAVGLAITRRLDKVRMVSFLVAAAIMALPLALQLHYPNLIKLDPAAYNADAGTLGTITPYRYGPFLVAKINGGFTAGQTILYAVIASVALLAKRLRKLPSWFLVTLAGLLFGLEIWAYNPLLLAVIGWLYLVYRIKHWPLKVTVLLTGLYYSLLAYNPLVIGLIENHLPWWFLSRFEYFNVLVFMTLPLGILFLHVTPAFEWRLSKMSWFVYGAIGLILLAPIHKANPDYGVFASFDSVTSLSWDSKFQQPYINTLNSIYALKPELQNKVIMSNDDDLTLRIPEVVKSSVISFGHDQNATPMANLPLRKQCTALLITNLDASDLAAAKVDMIAIRSSNQGFLDLLNSKPYIKFEASSGGISVYSVSLPAGTIASNSACAIPSGQ